MQDLYLISVIGDPIIDEYIYYKNENARHLNVERIVKHGGALNTFNSIYRLLGNLAEITNLQNEIPAEAQKTNNLLYLRREFFEDSNKQSEPFYSSKTPQNHYSNPKYKRIINVTPSTYRSSTLVFSDYKKGMLHNVSVEGKFNTAIYDSKYRSIPYHLFNSGYLSIWRCTGDEFNESYALNFDYIIHSDGASPVKIYHVRNNALHLFASVPVPNTEVVDTIGAGDTMTAAIAVYLTFIKTETPYDLINATKFAIDACQTVITQKYVALPKITFDLWIKNVRNKS